MFFSTNIWLYWYLFSNNAIFGLLAGFNPEKISSIYILATLLGVPFKESSFKSNPITSIICANKSDIFSFFSSSFNKKASALENTVVLCISKDLPFAQARFCGAEGIENVINLSDFQEGSFGKANGLEIVDGPLKGLHSRVLIVADADGTILHTEQVAEIANEPNYEAALAVL